MKAILTVIGKDKVGIIAGVSTMIMMLDLKLSNSNFEEIKKSLELKGKELGVDVKIQREEIFNSIYSV